MNINGLLCVQIMLGLLVPPTIIYIEFKTFDELRLLPQTAEEHIHGIGGESDSENSSIMGSDDEADEEHLSDDEEERAASPQQVGAMSIVDDGRRRSHLDAMMGGRRRPLVVGWRRRRSHVDRLSGSELGPIEENKVGDVIMDIEMAAGSIFKLAGQ